MRTWKTWAKQLDLRMGIVLHAARLCVWLTRRILWVLMQLAHAISCFMLRQMEYDADSYETKIAGSEVFAQTSLRLQNLNIASQAAYAEMQEGWNSKRLPDNVPALMVHKSRQIPVETMNKLRATFEERKTGLFDTHPSDRDRVRAAAALNEPGVFRLEEPAAGLLTISRR